MNNKTKRLESLDLNKLDLETFKAILKDLGSTDTSLTNLVQAISEIKVLQVTSTDSYNTDQYNTILKLLDITVNSLTELYFRDTLNNLLEAIEFIYISCTPATNSLYLLEKALVKIGYNVALERYILEGNVTVL